MHGHKAKDCPKNNKKFSIESNIAYQERKRSSKEDAKEEDEDPSQSKWVPTKGTKVTPPANNKKRDKEGEKVNFTTEEVVFDVREDEQFFLASAGNSEIDLVLDTAAETSTLDPHNKEILVNVREEDMILTGIGGSIKSKEVGQSIFGKTRVFKIKDNKALISYPCACSKWSISSPERGSIVLKEWPGVEYTGLEFLFKQDKEKYGDILFSPHIEEKRFSEVCCIRWRRRNGLFFLLPKRTSEPQRPIIR
jgi:hypothetical protein